MYQNSEPTKSSTHKTTKTKKSLIKRLLSISEDESDDDYLFDHTYSPMASAKILDRPIVRKESFIKRILNNEKDGLIHPYPWRSLQDTSTNFSYTTSLPQKSSMRCKKFRV